MTDDLYTETTASKVQSWGAFLMSRGFFDSLEELEDCELFVLKACILANPAPWSLTVVDRIYSYRSDLN